MAEQERHLLVCGDDPAADWQQLQTLLRSGSVVGVCGQEDAASLQAALQPGWCHTTTTLHVVSQRLPDGCVEPLLPDTDPPTAVVLGSGGSSGRRRWCLQPLKRLRCAAEALAEWPPAAGLGGLAGALPLHHVSGLMPLLRSETLGCAHGFLRRQQWREPERLPPLPGWGCSLVPTQLKRLLATAAGVAWLQQLGCIWVGGAALAAPLAHRAREAGVRLAPCYGATETGAMVTALAPDDFLAGAAGCGWPLAHARLRNHREDQQLEVRCDSLAAGFMVAGTLQPLPLRGGWWRSGDRAVPTAAGWQVLGRVDGAVNSGGETVFPEAIEARLAGLPNLEAVLILGVPDDTWGQRLVGLYRGRVATAALEQAMARRPPWERPRQWIHCPSLAPNHQGKWERERWRRWLETAQRQRRASTM